MPIDRTKNVYWVQERASCAKGSFRIKANPTTLVRMCCPKGKWKRGKCVGGMRLQAIGYKKTPAYSDVRYPLAKNIKKVTLKGRKR
jgi:hypothetical protein